MKTRSPQPLTLQLTYSSKAKIWPETRRVVNINTVTFWRNQNIAIVFVLIASFLTFTPQPPAEAAAPTCAQGGVCQVGDIGPGGGIVFYVASGTFTQTGATGTMCANSCKYLEAAPSGWNTGSDPNRSYNSDNGTVGVNARGTAIGSGYRNSLTIATSYADTSTSAAALARSYRGGTKQDWYLASKDELNQLCKWVRGQAWGSDATICDNSGTINSGAASGYGAATYWSSTENVGNLFTAWWQSFVSGEQSTVEYKMNARLVRPIRAFAQETFACGTSGTFTVINYQVTGNTSCTGSAVVPEGVTALGTSFYNSSINSITLPSTLVTIGDSALRETQLTSVVIPASVTSIGFLSLASRFITSVTFATGSQLRTIGGYAFQSTKFTSITFPSTVTTIASTAFELNPNLATVNFLGSIPSGSPWSAPVGATVSKLTCDGSSRTCAVGENGPGGGTIYYYSSGGFNCGPTQSDTCNYLEVAPSTWSGASDPLKFWANASDYNYKIAGVSATGDPPPLASDGVGLGYKDSLAIITNGRSIDSTTAAGAARAYSGGSKSDWYLPSPAELNLLCQWARGVAPSITTSCTGGTLNSTTYGAGSAGFTRDYYWTSTQENIASYAHTRRFDTGNAYAALKNANFVGVRPIRAFAPGLAPAFSISSSSETVTAGTAITGYTITSTGGAIASYSVSPDISNTPGLAFSTSTGLISGTPTTAASSRTYTITATNSTPPNATRTFTITVNLAAPAFSITSSSETVTAGSPITGYTITSTGGTVASYSISPEISNTPGLSFSTSTGLISGTPTTAASSRTYTITATNSTPPNATRTFTITVNLAAVAITLSPSTISGTVGSAITSYAISSTGGTIASYSISPAISNTPGLSFSTSTGLISGTPTTAAATRTYTITATNATSSAAQNFSITITAPTQENVDSGPPPSFLKVKTSPTISLTLNTYTCNAGVLIFWRYSTTEEPSKLSYQKISLLRNGEAVASTETLKPLATFEKNSAWAGSTMTCQVIANQEHTTGIFTSLNSDQYNELAKTQGAAIKAADTKYFADRTAAYEKKRIELRRISDARAKDLSTATTTAQARAAEAKYRAGLTQTSKTWKAEIDAAIQKRASSKAEAPKAFNQGLEKFGLAIIQS